MPVSLTGYLVHPILLLVLARTTQSSAASAAVGGRSCITFTTYAVHKVRATHWHALPIMESASYNTYKYRHSLAGSIISSQSPNTSFVVLQWFTTLQWTTSRFVFERVRLFDLMSIIFFHYLTRYAYNTNILLFSMSRSRYRSRGLKDSVSDVLRSLNKKLTIRWD